MNVDSYSSYIREILVHANRRKVGAKRWIGMPRRGMSVESERHERDAPASGLVGHQPNVAASAAPALSRFRRSLRSAPNLLNAIFKTGSISSPRLDPINY